MGHHINEVATHQFFFPPFFFFFFFFFLLKKKENKKTPTLLGEIMTTSVASFAPKDDW